MTKSTQIRYTASIRRGFGFIVGSTEGPKAQALAERSLDWMKQEYDEQLKWDAAKALTKTQPDEEGETQEPCPTNPTSTPTPETPPPAASPSDPQPG